jgi:carbon-monoxide dehydrogenase large subunit
MSMLRDASLSAMERSQVGSSVKRREDVRLLTGTAQFVDDIHVPNVHHAHFVRSKHAHARIKRVDLTRAMATSGVVLALSGEECRDLMAFPRGVKAMKIPLLAADRVRFVGEPIALIVADTPYRAEDAGDLVEVEYDPLPVVSDPQRSLDAAAPVLHEDWTDNEMLDVPYLFGDVDRAFEKADLIVREQLGMSRLAASPLECRQVLASFDKVSQQLTVTVASQTVHGYRFLLANVLSLPENHIRVIVPEVGGAFGNKGVYREEVAVCRAAMILGGTVKWVESRSENLIGSSHARDQFHEVELAVTNDGEILAMKDRILADMGAYWAIQGWDPMRYTIDLLTGPYRIRNCDFRVTCVATNKAPNGAFRGFGMEMGNFVIERMMDIVAARIGLDPVAIRRKNMISRADFPYVTPTGVFYEQNSFTECLDHLVREVDYAALRDWQGKLRQEGRSIGIGLSMHIESCAPDKQAPTMGLPGYESARVTIDPSGLVTVFSGLCPQGQGSETTLAQVAADELTVPIETSLSSSATALHAHPGLGPSEVGVPSWAARPSTGHATCSNARSCRSQRRSWTPNATAWSFGAQKSGLGMNPHERWVSRTSPQSATCSHPFFPRRSGPLWTRPTRSPLPISDRSTSAVRGTFPRRIRMERTLRSSKWTRRWVRLDSCASLPYMIAGT